MKAIILSPEQSGLEPIKITIRDKDYKKIKHLQYSGGFKRFGIDLYEDKINGRTTESDYDKLGRWLWKIFGSSLTNAKTIKP